MKDKTNLKIIVAMIITAIISISGTVLAESLINANQINYNNTTVADALDGMYKINSFQTDYSTDEKVVGTWIDGKPLYQKTITVDYTKPDSASAAYSHSWDLTPYAIDMPIDTKIIYKSNDVYFAGNAISNNGMAFSVFASIDTQNRLVITAGNTIAGRLSTIYVTFQYTKTTDQPITQ